MMMLLFTSLIDSCTYNVILRDKVKIELYPLPTVGEQVACEKN
jgi:hypothetical protein